MKELRLPNLSEGVESAVVSYWHFQENDFVKEKEDLVEMVTDKATFNIPAPFSGKVKKINFKEGETVKVGEVLAIIE